MLADPGSTAAAMRAVATAFVRQAADAAGVEWSARSLWAEFGIWVPAGEPEQAAAQLVDLFGGCSPDAPVVVEVLWKHWQADAPTWWRTKVMEVESDPARPWMRVWWADPATSMMELTDVAAVRQCPDVLPVSCCEFVKPSFLRPASLPGALLPQVEISTDEASTLITHYLHHESHRVGPLWTTLDAQAAATRDRLLEVIQTAAASALRVEVNVVAWVYDTHVPCATHAYEPLPAYATDGDATCGMRLVAHLHRDATVGWEGDLEHLSAVLTVVALYGGSVHLATTGLGDSQRPVAEETTYKVFYDWRAERVEDPEDRHIRELNAMLGKSDRR